MVVSLFSMNASLDGGMPSGTRMLKIAIRGGAIALSGFVVVLIGLVASESTFRKTSSVLRYAHGVCMCIWTFLVLVGMFASRMWKHKRQWWVKVHAVIMCTAAIVGIGGVLLGILNGTYERTLRSDLRKTKYRLIDPHRGIGYTVVALMVCQYLFTQIWRPARTSHFRLFWNLWHHYQGRALIGLSICNVFIGLRIANKDHGVSMKYFYAMVIILGVEVAAFFSYGAYLYLYGISIESHTYLVIGDDENMEKGEMEGMMQNPSFGNKGLAAGMMMSPTGMNTSSRPPAFQTGAFQTPNTQGGSMNSLPKPASAGIGFRAVQAAAKFSGTMNRPPPFSPGNVKAPPGNSVL